MTRNNYKKLWQDFNELTVETYLERSKADNKKKLAELRQKIEKLEKSEKNS